VDRNWSEQNKIGACAISRNFLFRLIRRRCWTDNKKLKYFQLFLVRSTDSTWRPIKMPYYLTWIKIIKYLYKISNWRMWDWNELHFFPFPIRSFHLSFYWKSLAGSDPVRSAAYYPEWKLALRLQLSSSNLKFMYIYQATYCCVRLCVNIKIF
jgi:hypothetical protein